MSERRRWSPEEIALATAMKAAGAKYIDIAAAIPGRNPQQVRGFLEYHTLGATGRAIRAERARQWRERNPGHKAPSRIAHMVVPITVDQRAFNERDRRALLAPRDLTAAFFGDPLPGYSALDRRTT